MCPVVKAIWTPSWVLYSGGLCFALLGAFYAVVDMLHFNRAAFFFTVIGMNSLVAYAMSHVYPAMAFNSLRRLFGNRIFELFGAAYTPLVYGVGVLMLYWLVLYALYRRQVLIRI